MKKHNNLITSRSYPKGTRQEVTSKKGQEVNRKFPCLSYLQNNLKVTSKKGQEEMIGFAVIIIMVAIVMLVFLGLSMNKSESDLVESYEIESFVQSALQYHTQCYYNWKYIDIKDLIFRCSNEQMCDDDVDPCVELNETLKEIIGESWKVEGDRPVKGYEMNIFSNGEELIFFDKGNITNNYKGTSVPYTKSGVSIEILLKVYY